MLVLSRKKGERIVIDSPAGLITIQYLESHGPSIRLGIEADSSMRVYRGEVWDAKQQEGTACEPT